MHPITIMQLLQSVVYCILFLANELMTTENLLFNLTPMSNNQSRLSFALSSQPYLSSCKKLSETEDCQTVKTRFSDLPVLDISMFSTTYSVKRVNEIKPKPKLIIPERSTSKKSTVETATETPHKEKRKESIKYDAIKSPLFNWKKYVPMCGFETKTGENGCLCGNPCPFQKEWTAHYKEGDFRLYQQLLSETVKKSQEVQIDKDLLRTHPECLTFSNNPMFQEMLRQVLRQYSVYDPQVGYVQGINLIVGAILYHMKNAQLTFWAFVDLMDEKQLRMIYLPGFAYLHLHQTRIISILDEKVNDLSRKMDELNIIPSSFLNGWILSLMGVCIPLEHMHLLIQKFRKFGWNFIYQLIITYLLFLKESLLQAEDQSEFLVSLNTKSSMEYGIVWEELISNANNFPLHSESLLKSTTSSRFF